jgi:hypothetical protein
MITQKKQDIITYMAEKRFKLFMERFATEYYGRRLGVMENGEIYGDAGRKLGDDSQEIGSNRETVNPGEPERTIPQTGDRFKATNLNPNDIT